jgi:hypothetical protein
MKILLESGSGLVKVIEIRRVQNDQMGGPEMIKLGSGNYQNGGPEMIKMGSENDQNGGSEMTKWGVRNDEMGGPK